MLTFPISLIKMAISNFSNRNTSGPGRRFNCDFKEKNIGFRKN